MLFDESRLAGLQAHILSSIINMKHNIISLVWDESNEILLVSDTIENYFDFTVEDTISRFWYFLFPAHIVQQILLHFNNTSKKFTHSEQLLTSNRNGKTYFSITIEVVVIDHERLFICTLEDITPTKTLKQKLNNVEKSLLSAQLSANIVHEIRNPLTAVKGFLQLIQAGIDYKEQYIRVLINEIDKIEGLTNELLQLANPNKDKKDHISVDELLNDVILIMKTQSKMKNIIFEVTGDTNISIYCNPNEMKQVFINLILNGIEAMDGVGTITIHVKQIANSVQIEIIDDGHGMSEETKNKISNAFFTTKETGTGLGLVVTKHIIQKHHGKLQIVSFENQGSVFKIQLPKRIDN